MSANIKKFHVNHHYYLIMVSPSTGGAKRTRYLAKSFFDDSFAMLALISASERNAKVDKILGLQTVSRKADIPLVGAWRIKL